MAMKLDINVEISFPTPCTEDTISMQDLGQFVFVSSMYPTARDDLSLEEIEGTVVAGKRLSLELSKVDAISLSWPVEEVGQS